MNALTRDTIRLPKPTQDEPIPSLVGGPGLKSLRSATAHRLAQMLTGAEREETIQASRAICASLMPASAAEIAAVVEGLALHFPVLRRTDGENRIVQKHWLEDLDGWPVDLLVECARLWRVSGKDRFPTSGQFVKPMEPVLEHRQALFRRAAEFLEIVDVAAT